MTRHVALARRSGLTLTALALGSALLLAFANTAGAAIVPNVPMGAAANYSALGGLGVSNSGLTTMHENLGVSPGPTTAVTGFPPGQVLTPGVLDNPGAAQAQLDLTAAYNDTHNRGTLTGVTGTDLSGQTLQGGVYAATTAPKLQLGLTGTLTLDGAGNPNSVFIFQTDSTLITGSSSVVRLINGAQECNVYWQVGSSATLGSGSTFAGNILALTTISMQDDVAVHGRALARNGSVTLINDHFTAPTCAASLPAPTTTVAPTSTTVAPGSTLPGGVTPSTAPGGVTTSTSGNGATTTTLGLTVGIVGPPRTGVAPLPTRDFPWPAVLAVGVAGAAATGVIVRRRLHGRGASR
ncbi:MAG TPA: ice-binding family protein [Acidimicrobiia bacterium]